MRTAIPRIGLIYVAAFVVLLLLMRRELDVYDESLVLVGARMLTSGAVIHRDFYSPYGIANFAAVEAASAIAGGKLFLAGRVYGATVRAGIVAATYALLAGRTSSPTRLMVTVMVAAWLIATPYYLYPIFPVMLFALISAALLLGGGARPNRVRLAAAGACAGAAAMFRYDGGFALAVGETLYLAALRRPGELACRPIRAVAFYVLGTLIVFAPLAVAYLLIAPLADLLR